MVALGVILVLLAIALGVLLVAGTASLDGTIDMTVPGGTLSVDPVTFVVLGMAVIALLWLGWVVLRTGTRRTRRRRAEAKRAAEEAAAERAAEEQRLKDEVADRERQLAEERRRQAPGDGPPASDAPRSTPAPTTEGSTESTASTPASDATTAPDDGPERAGGPGTT